MINIHFLLLVACFFLSSSAISKNNIEDNMQKLLEERQRDSEYVGVDKIHEYNAFALKHNQEIFEFQLFSSKILFGLVIFIILFGLILSGLQFLKKDLPDEKATSLEIGMSGVKISSDILGLLILTISLAFFYIYLNNVYPVNFQKSVKLEETIN
jgi:hypothetical protein